MFITFNIMVIFVLTENVCDRQEQDLDSYRDMQVYIDIIAMLLAANMKNVDEEKSNEIDSDIFPAIANVLPQFLKYFKVILR